jgi:cell division protein FtsB
MPAAQVRRRRRPPTATLARRWLAVILIAMIGYAYYHPLRSWFETRSELHSRSNEVAQLGTLKRDLQQRVHASESLDSVAKQARQLGYIRPGEHLFIVKGIKAWKKAHSRIEGGGQ